VTRDTTQRKPKRRFGNCITTFIKTESNMEDKIVQTVIEAYKERSKVGIEKYGKTMEREDLSALDWLQHLQEELMDATLYIESLKRKYRLITTGTMKNIEL
jgi:hypothetical protein